MTRLLAALLLTLSLAACRKETAPAPTPIATASTTPPVEQPVAPPAKAGAALAVTGVETGTAVGTDFRVATPVSAFARTDTIITAITLHNEGAPTAGNITARWLGPDGKVINEESQAQDFGGDQTINFRVANPNGFKPGSYKLEVALNGSVVETREFTVR